MASLKMGSSKGNNVPLSEAPQNTRKYDFDTNWDQSLMSR